jgi:hypothetical protein
MGTTMERPAANLLPNSVVQPRTGRGAGGRSRPIHEIAQHVAGQNRMGRDGANRITKPLLYH